MSSSTSSSSSASFTAKLGHLQNTLCRQPLGKHPVSPTPCCCLSHPGFCYQNRTQQSLPPLEASLFTPPSATKLNHILAGFALPTLRLLTDLKSNKRVGQGAIHREEFCLVSCFETRSLYIVLVDLKLIEIHLPLQTNAGWKLKACVTTPSPELSKLCMLRVSEMFWWVKVPSLLSLVSSMPKTHSKTPKLLPTSTCTLQPLR